MEAGFGLSHPSIFFYFYFFTTADVCLVHPISSLVLPGAHVAQAALWVSRIDCSRKKRLLNHSRRKHVWSGFERDGVTCSPYVSAFHQLCLDSKPVASLSNKPQLLCCLLKVGMSCQSVKSPYTDQTRDRLTQSPIRGKMVVICSARAGGWLTGPFGAVFFVRCHCQLNLLSASTMSKKVYSDLSVSICRGPSEEAVRTSVSVPDGAAVLPGEEWVAFRGLCKQLSLGRA